jgi:hypothetical protein
MKRIKIAKIRDEKIEKEWLKHKISIEEAENKYIVKDDRLGPNPLPFGFAHQEWLKFQEEIRQGDELWEFSSPEETWANMCGREGIALVPQILIVFSSKQLKIFTMN